MKNVLFILLYIPSIAFAQKYVSESAYIKFFSSAPIEDITATNESANSVLDLDNGTFVFSVKIKGFQFEKSLMQEHFNENYLESDKYPKSTFSGKIVDWKNENGKKTVIAAGELTIHGVKRQVEIESTIEVSEGDVKVEAVFPIKLEDYKIKIPKAVFYNIAEEVEVTVKFDYKPYTK